MFALLGQTAPSGSDPISLLATYGFPGVIVAAILLGFLWAKPAVDDLKDRVKKAETQRDELLKVYEDKIIPKIVLTEEVMNGLKPVLLDVVRTLEAVRAQLSWTERPARGGPKEGR